MNYYTLVRHKAFSVNNDERFRYAVELRGATLTDKQIEVLRENKAIVEVEYDKITRIEEAFNYPSRNIGIYPNVANAGTFMLLKGSGIDEEIFIPNTAKV